MLKLRLDSVNDKTECSARASAVDVSDCTTSGAWFEIIAPVLASLFGAENKTKSDHAKFSYGSQTEHNKKILNTLNYEQIHAYEIGIEKCNYNAIIDARDLTVQLGSLPNTCFTESTLVLTQDGLKPIQSLHVGQLITTRHNGQQPLLGIWKTDCTREVQEQFPQFQPIRIAENAIGDHKETRVSQRQRILVSIRKTMSECEPKETLVEARNLVNGTTVVIEKSNKPIIYFYLMFEGQEIICADGVWSASLIPIVSGREKTTQPTSDDVQLLFPAVEAMMTMPVTRPPLTAADVITVAGSPP